MTQTPRGEAYPLLIQRPANKTYSKSQRYGRSLPLSNLSVSKHRLAVFATLVPVAPSNIYPTAASHHKTCSFSTYQTPGDSTT